MFRGPREAHVAERVAARGRVAERDREAPAARRRFGKGEGAQVHVVLPLLAGVQLLLRERPPRAVRRRAREGGVRALLPAVRREEAAFPQGRPVVAREGDVVHDFLHTVRADRDLRPGRLHREAFGGRHRPGEDGDVLVEAVRIRRGGQLGRERTAALDVRQRVADRLHRVGRRDPGSAGHRVAAAVREAHAQAALRRLLDGELDGVEPLRRVERERAGRDGAARVEDRHAAEADGRHRVEVGHDARARDVAVHPVPPHLRPCGGGRLAERGEKGVVGTGDSGARADGAERHLPEKVCMECHAAIIAQSRVPEIPLVP